MKPVVSIKLASLRYRVAAERLRFLCGVVRETPEASDRDPVNRTLHRPRSLLVSCDFKENPAGFVEVDRAEILAIDLLRRPKAMVRDKLVRHLRLSRVICGAECDVMNRAPAKLTGKKPLRLAYSPPSWDLLRPAMPVNPAAIGSTANIST
jgi:hypothetical protein